MAVGLCICSLQLLHKASLKKIIQDSGYENTFKKFQEAAIYVTLLLKHFHKFGYHWKKHFH